MCYQAFYSPKIATPMFHTIGLSDTTISPSQTRKLAKDCENPWLYQYPGGHYVPQSKEYGELYGRLAGFLRKAIGISVDNPEERIEVDATPK
jgi:hypothetical protein